MEKFEINGTTLIKCLDQNLVTADIPEGITVIGKAAFRGCNNLVTVNIPDGVKEIQVAAFKYCLNLVVVNLPNTLETLGAAAFLGCCHLAMLKLPDGITKIEDRTFWGCENLSIVQLPKNLMTIGCQAFACCKNLSTMNIPSTVTDIESLAFFSCEKLRKINLPNVDVIKNGTFRTCVNLENIYVPNSVKCIEDNAFENCRNLETVVLPDGLTHIGYHAFAYTKIRSLTIPDSVTQIGTAAFPPCQLIVCGYTIDSAEWDDKVPFSDIQDMLTTKQYNVKMDRKTKYQFVAQVFLKDHQPEAATYIKSNIAKIMSYFIDKNDYQTVRGLLMSGPFVNKRNAMSFLDHAFDKPRGKKKIILLLTQYCIDHNVDIFRCIQE